VPRLNKELVPGDSEIGLGWCRIQCLEAKSALSWNQIFDLVTDKGNSLAASAPTENSRVKLTSTLDDTVLATLR
jgi:hypothetical protein